MIRSFKLRGVAVLVVALSLVAGACGDDDDGDDASADAATEETTTTASAEICDTDAIVEAVEGGDAEGTLDGMTDDPVGTAASNNPVLTTLTAAVTEAGLVDTLNTAESLTVFAPTDCAFAALDPATMDAAMADPTGLLTQVLGFHVVAGQQLSAEQLAGETSLETFSGGMLPIEASGGGITLNGGQATVVVPDIQTANATVHLIDDVMLPPEG
jgi:transforming growth factor-beta-induced protein